MTVEFKLPDLGENIEAADVVNVLVEEGHVIKENQNVLELETDKAVVELPCPNAGRVVKVHVKAGDKINVGAPILTLEKTEKAPEKPTPEKKEEAPPPEEEREPAAEKEPAVVQEVKEPPPERKTEAAAVEEEEKEEEKAPAEALRTEERRRAPAPAGPATRRLARELGVDLYQVSGSGPGGRITAEDVQSFVKKTMSQAMMGLRPAAAAPALPDFSKWGPVERQPMSGIRRKTAENVSLAWQLAPQVTQYDLADITELEAARKRYGRDRGEAPGKVTVTVLALKAATAALKAFPQFNSSLDAAAGTIIFKKYYHLGVAVDTEHGLLVPVLRDVDRKSILDLAVELEQLAEKARQRKLDVEQMRGGTFTITNLGGIGGTAFSPIVNYPEVAILGIARARLEPVILEGRTEPRLMMPLSLSYDHRVIDGADGARFLRKVADLLADPLQLLLEG